jgi:hypothetical protein
MLQQSARDCLSRLKSAEKGKEGLEEAQLLSKLHDDLSTVARKFHETSAKAKMLIDAGIPIAVPPGLAKHQELISSTAERFREKPVSTTLKQGKKWPNLLGAIGEAATATEAALTAAWKLYIGSSLFAGPPPDEEARTMAATPKNQKALEAYRRLFERFASLRSSVPASAQIVKDLRKLSADLTAIEFDRNVPRAIKSFLDATGTTTGASLDLLTDEVREWLIKHSLFERYVIRSKVG